jgi:hypothetical protein
MMSIFWSRPANNCNAGYRITMRVDAVAFAASGVGKSQPLHGDPQRLKEDLIRREVHLIAAPLNIPGRCFRQRFGTASRSDAGWSAPVFPEKWLTSWKRHNRAPFAQHLNQWKQLLEESKGRHGVLTGVGTCPSMMIELSA